MKYKVEITETLQRVIEVETDSKCDAIKAISTQYAIGNIVLDSRDIVSYEITEFKED